MAVDTSVFAAQARLLKLNQSSHCFHMATTCHHHASEIVANPNF